MSPLNSVRLPTFLKSDLKIEYIEPYIISAVIHLDPGFKDPASAWPCFIVLQSVFALWYSILVKIHNHLDVG